ALPLTSQPHPVWDPGNVSIGAPTVSYHAASHTYHMFGTGVNFPMFSSPNITGPWTRHGVVLPGGSKIGLEGGMWAPDVQHIKLGNGFALYYCISNLGDKNSVIGVATSPNMKEGSWKDYGKVIRSDPSKKWNAIDANTITTGGKIYLNFGSYSQGIFQWEMKNITHPKPPKLLVANQGHTEASNVYKPANLKWFYVFWSEGDNAFRRIPKPGEEYKVLVGRGPTVSGPFKDKAGNLLNKKYTKKVGTLVLGSHDNVYAPGGQSVFHDPVSGRDMITYHFLKKAEYNPTRHVGINYLDFSSGWPVVVKK
ncbi:glycoside hydrolase family 43 protein, partial [Auricularia subglabra TFB-10046 SS5]